MTSLSPAREHILQVWERLLREMEKVKIEKNIYRFPLLLQGPVSGPVYFYWTLFFFCNLIGEIYIIHQICSYANYNIFANLSRLFWQNSFVNVPYPFRLPTREQQQGLARLAGGLGRVLHRELRKPQQAGLGRTQLRCQKPGKPVKSSMPRPRRFPM